MKGLYWLPRPTAWRDQLRELAENGTSRWSDAVAMANLRLDFLKTNALDAVAQLRFANNAFHGPNHSGFNFEMHETILGAGTRTHAPHKHEHEEIIVVFAGTVETYLEGRTEIAETGSVIYFASNQMHSARNAGTVPCRYYVIELRGA